MTLACGEGLLTLRGFVFFASLLCSWSHLALMHGHVFLAGIDQMYLSMLAILLEDAWSLQTMIHGRVEAGRGSSRVLALEGSCLPLRTTTSSIRNLSGNRKLVVCVQASVCAHRSEETTPA